jgi:5-methyltetrahydrofolate--homocysteine methyltransferase
MENIVMEEGKMRENLKTILRSKKKEVTICRDYGIVMIGERINPTGRKVLQEDLKAGKFDRVRKDAVAQIAAGAAILDVNAGVPRVNEPTLLVRMIQEVREATDDAVLCIDSPNTSALEAALKFYCRDGAKPLINSVSAETVRLRDVLPLIKEYGAAVIGLASSDDGIPKTAERRFENAARIIEEATKTGIPVEDVVIDPVVVTLGAEWNSGLAILKAISMIVEKFGANITMGASNVSFGMADRPNLTAHFLSMAAVVGLSCPICNPLEEKERIALQAADLILGRDEYGMKWIEDFRARKGS